MGRVSPGGSERVGLNVLVVSRTIGDAENVAAEIGPNAQAFAADVTSQDDCMAMAEAATNRYGGIDILCANAGIFPSARLGDMTAQDFEHVLRTNLTGTFLSRVGSIAAMKRKPGRADRDHILDHRPDRPDLWVGEHYGASESRAAAASCVRPPWNSHRGTSP